MAKRVVVTGAAGRLGRVLCAALASAGHHVVPLTRADLEITDGDAVARAIAGAAPDAVVNCTAYNAVDGAESDAPSAFAVNERGPGLLAAAADRAGAVLVHFSTDFVFDGTAREPYVESDRVGPLSVYGASKLAGEAAVAGACARHYVLRVASLFGGTGVGGHRATIDAIADTLAAGGIVRALTDRTVSPSYVPDVAAATRALLERAAPFGLYHCVGTGSTTWYEMAHHLAGLMGVEGRIDGIDAAAFRTAARRPQYCALSNAKLRAAGVDAPSWQSALARHVAARAAGDQPVSRPAGDTAMSDTRSTVER